MRRVFQGAVFSFPALMLLLVYVGDFHRDPYHTTPVFFGLLVAWALGCRFLGWKADEPPAGEMERGLWARGETAWWIRASAVAAAALIYVLLSDRTYQGMRLYPHQTDGVMAAVWVGAGLLAVLLVRPPRLCVSLGILVLAGVIVRACGLWQWEINPARRDMLALVLSALDTFLSGENPYGFHQMQVGSSVPLTYPPGLWLAHLPAHVLGLDIRWTGVVADGAMAAAIGGVCIRRKMRSIGPTFLALGVYLFLPDVHWNGIYAEPNFDWAILGFLTVSVITRRPILLGVMMGLALATRPFNLVLVPFLLIWLVRTWGLRGAWRTILVTGLVAAALYLPFVLADPDAFYVGTVRWLLEYGPAHNKWFWGMMGVSGQLYKHNLSDWLLPLQLGTVSLLLGLAAWRLRTVRGLAAFWALAYALFVSFNSIIWMSFWVGVCVLAVAGTAAAGDTSSLKPAQTPGFLTRRGRWMVTLEVVSSAAVLLSTVLLGYYLLSHFSRRWSEEVRSSLIADLEKGDLVLDLTGWRVAFLKMPYVLEREDLPTGASLARDPFTSALPRRGVLDPLSFPRVLVVERYGLFDDYEELYLGEEEAGGPYALEQERSIGLYRLLVLKRKGAASPKRLSRDLASLEVTALGKDGRETGASWTGDIWKWPGGKGWQRVGPAQGSFLGVKAKLLWCHPWDEGARVKISWPVDSDARWITLWGGLDDKAPQWRREPVMVEVMAGGASLDHRYFPNARGLSGFSVKLPRGAGKVDLLVSARNSAKRHFYLEAAVSGSVR